MLSATVGVTATTATASAIDVAVLTLLLLLLLLLLACCCRLLLYSAYWSLRSLILLPLLLLSAKFLALR